ncbi:hypothetical protein TNCV_1847731 [Trichonephila clavipes]|nr:hypothetical protein TNCV_1847731 [Trichonephila clavipes]
MVSTFSLNTQECSEHYSHNRPVDLVMDERTNRGSLRLQGVEKCAETERERVYRRERKSGIKKFSLQEALDLLQNLPPEISDVLTEDISEEEVRTNNLLKFSFDS